MSKKTNISLIANGEVFGFPAEFGIARINNETTIIGSLNTKGKNPGDFIQNKELGITELSDQLTILPESGTEFSVSFARKPKQTAFALTSSGILCGILLTEESKQMLLTLNTSRLKSGNKFEQFVSDVAEWAEISELTLIIRNKGGMSYSFLQQLSEGFDKVMIPKSYEKYQLIATGIFELSRTDFGQCISTLTKQNQLLFAVGGSFTEKSFGAQLISEKIETDTFILENFMFGLQRSSKGFYCLATGTFTFKLEDRNICFILSGAVSPGSFMLSAASSSDARIPLNSRLSFSDLALSIGVNSGKVSFGMTGRLNTNNLSIFAGFAINPPKITLFTAALTSTTGRISLKDLVVEIADIQWEAVNCLDVVAIGDFDIQNISLSNGGINNFPTNNKAEDYNESKRSIETNTKKDFNEKMSALKIEGDAQLTPLGNNTGQYILTDKGTMRHYRIDRSGKISLNCQIYVCSQPTKLGNYDMPVGFFICGTMEIFGTKIRFLFLADKGKSLIALVQMDKINILKGLFVIEKSQKPLPIEPINGGVAGQLVKPNNQGATLYLNIQKDKGELTFYVSAHLSILKIFDFDTLILIKDKLVYINIETQLAGFKTTFNLQGSYQNFSESGFTARVVFDTSGFREILEKAQKALRSAAESVEKGVKEATRKVDEAQQNVLNLQRKIDGYNDRINQCKREISSAKWYQIGKKIARGLEIAGLEIAKAGVYVAIGVAYGALEVAKAALKLGGAIVSSVLKSVAYIIEAATQILWIKSFELGITATPQIQKINAELVLTILGNDVRLAGELNLTGLVENIKNFVSGGVKEKSDKLIEDAKNGKVTRAIEATPDSEIDLAFVQEYCDLNKNQKRYEELRLLQDAADDLFIDSNNAYFDAFNEEHPDERENACHLTELRWEEEIFHKQHSDAFDDDFVESLDNVIQVIRQEKTTSRANISEEMENKMDNLLHTVKTIRTEKEYRAKRAQERESLFSRVERNMEMKRSSMRSRDAETERSAEEANEQYANDLSRLIEQHLGDKEGETAENLKRTFGISLYRFRNQEDTFEQ
ncbi:hypothetical protein [Bacteroides faecium]|uniref:Uncharacterized protein n=1 Tax=Bacteroides faecium TaxID=2715212 RepID=A0A6H0KIK6_9BACE|nr:hypothetical protein [Bacteroides faecium]QIU93256.1 hypothetical protein BacF7301_03435 [Bacteroides faecium]